MDIRVIALPAGLISCCAPGLLPAGLLPPGQYFLFVPHHMLSEACLERNMSSHGNNSTSNCTRIGTGAYCTTVVHTASYVAGSTQRAILHAQANVQIQIEPL